MDETNEVLQDEFDEVDLNEFLSDDTADQPETDQSAADRETEGREAETVEEAETPEQAQPEPEKFTLKYMDDTKEVGREEVITLAQQGMDYGRIRAQRDSLTGERDALEKEAKELRQFREDHADSVELLAEMARESGQSVSEFMENIRLNRYSAQFERQGMDRNNARVAAQERLGRERAEKAAQAAQKQNAAQETAPEDEHAKRMNEDVRGFLERFGNVNPQDIPQAVWERVSRGERLPDAYAAWQQEKETSELRAEVERLKEELEAEKQNNKNRQTSVGSQSTSAGEEGKDMFLAMLMADD